REREIVAGIGRAELECDRVDAEAGHGRELSLDFGANRGADDRIEVVELPHEIARPVLRGPAAPLELCVETVNGDAIVTEGLNGGDCARPSLHRARREDEKADGKRGSHSVRICWLDGAIVSV